MSTTAVAIVLGSESDRARTEETGKLLAQFGVSYEVVVASAHRSPDLLSRYVQDAEARGIQVFIAAAGGAAHLAGAIAARTVIPVIGVPLDATTLGGLDALLSTVQMPPGVPVATVAIGNWGAYNAAVLAIQILGMADPTLQNRLREWKRQRAQELEEHLPGHVSTPRGAR